MKRKIFLLLLIIGLVLVLSSCIPTCQLGLDCYPGH